MNKRLMTILKIAVLLVVAVLVVQALRKAWGKVDWNQIQVDWRWAPVAVAGFCGSMITSGLVWRILAKKMAGGKDRVPTLPLLGAYTFSQMGKYIPGKIALLLMRIERAGRFGMSAGDCTLSTLLENALYMISGAIFGMTANYTIAGEQDAKFRPYHWPITIAAVIFLAAACAPPVFYGLVNRLLQKMKRPAVGREKWLSAGTLALAVVGFMPCWIFGGLALWASACCIHRVDIAGCWWFGGVYALSVIIGMASLLPGGAGIRDAVLGAAAAMQFSASGMPHANAVIAGGAVAVFQRLFQVGAEILLGVSGGLVTSLPAARGTEPPIESPPDMPASTAGQSRLD